MRSVSAEVPAEVTAALLSHGAGGVPRRGQRRAAGRAGGGGGGVAGPPRPAGGAACWSTSKATAASPAMPGGGGPVADGGLVHQHLPGPARPRDRGPGRGRGGRPGRRARLVKRVKEQLRAVPGDGLGFGLLRYLNPRDRRRCWPRCPSRRSGSTTSAGSPVRRAGPRRPARRRQRRRRQWQLAGEQALGGDADAGMPAAHVLEAVAIARGPAGRAAADACGCRGRAGCWPRRRSAELAGDWVAALAGIAAHAARPGAGGHTPSDFPLVALAQEQIARAGGGGARAGRGVAAVAAAGGPAVPRPVRRAGPGRVHGAACLRPGRAAGRRGAAGGGAGAAGPAREPAGVFPPAWRAGRAGAGHPAARWRCRGGRRTVSGLGERGRAGRGGAAGGRGAGPPV